MKHKFKMQRTLVEEIELEVEIPDGSKPEDVYHSIRQIAKDQQGWEVVLVDRPEFVKSSFDLGPILLPPNLEDYDAL